MTSGRDCEACAGRRELQPSAPTHKLNSSVAPEKILLIARDSMPAPATQQSNQQSARELRVGVDVGGTFTDLVAFDARNLPVVKLPSSPPAFPNAVIEAVAPAPSSPSPGRPAAAWV